MAKVDDLTPKDRMRLTQLLLAIRKFPNAVLQQAGHAPDDKTVDSFVRERAEEIVTWCHACLCSVPEEATRTRNLSPSELEDKLQRERHYARSLQNGTKHFGKGDLYDLILHFAYRMQTHPEMGVKGMLFPRRMMEIPLDVRKQAHAELVNLPHALHVFDVCAEAVMEYYPPVPGRKLDDFRYWIIFNWVRMYREVTGENPPPSSDANFNKFVCQLLGYLYKEPFKDESKLIQRAINDCDDMS